MKYLLDTDVIIGHLRKRKAIPDEVIEEGFGVSIASYGELMYGAYKSEHVDKALEELNKFFARTPPNIIYANERVMEVFGKIKGDLEKEGQRLDDFDLVIAATAVAESLILCTYNLKHFQRIKGLDIYS
jgi:tRNA(fMet)-specific endonuclease VapC